MTAVDWAGAVREARESTGFGGEVPARTVAAARTAVRAERRAGFDRELGGLDGARRSMCSSVTGGSRLSSTSPKAGWEWECAGAGH